MRSKKKEIKNMESNQKYYTPLYCYRHYPSLYDLYNYIVNSLANYGKVNVYSDYTSAKEKAHSMLCDDDCYGIGCIDYTRGTADVYLVNQLEDKEIVKDEYGDTNMIFSLKEDKHINVVK